ncbi:TonB-dependent receptor plug domain-containing protein [Niastella sp. OAS944]|uniref:TonB-dependent receptor plug domain-containing protein n=1 Tax=Niastella sp. OAS944 TaxID=2664089 RepID=UPI0035C87950|nr:TonB-dependent SusC/RagA subfamily outer membrane receptor [Chitinophagaceae bacterium OAS944]
MRKSIRYCLLLLVCFCSLLTKAQSLDYADNKEKVYVQTSHVFFKPGETMFFKLYVVNANTQTPSFLSSAVYAEIIGPSGNVVQKINYGVENGYAEGSFEFSEQTAGGVYKLRAYTTWMRNETEQTFFEKEVTLMKVIAPRLLMKLDFPEKGYGPGDEVKADFSIRNLNDLPIRNYPAVYKVSIAGKVEYTNSFQTDEEGKAQLRFNLPGTLTSTDGLLNITIQYDSYTEAISRSIPIVLNNLDVQFMPEGGTLVQGITSHVAFRAINEHGKPVDIKGAVQDSKGNKVTDFESLRFGMGKFLFTPQKNETYTATITTPARIAQTFPLPMASAQGVVMSIENTANDQLFVKLSATSSCEVNLVGQTKNTNYLTQKVKLHAGENKLTVDKNKFPAGIARFTLYTNNDLPVAERLVFLNENKNLHVSISTSKPRYLPREKVILTVNTKDDKGNPVPSNLSLAVLDDKLWTFADDKQDNILSWLLMSSELKGKIEEPNFYFKKDEPSAPAALDLVMLTHGYRYFDYSAGVEEQGKLPFQPDQPYMLSGRIINSKYDPVKSTVYLVQDITKGKAIEYHTGADGVFYFSQLSPKSNYYLVAHAIGKNEKVTILITQNGVGFNPLRYLNANQQPLVKFKTQEAGPALTNDVKPVTVQELIQQQPEKGVVDFDFLKANNLEDVVVVGYGTQKKMDVTGSVAIIRADEIPKQNLQAALQGRIPGIIATPNAANPLDAPKVAIRGIRTVTNAMEPLLVIDGVPMENFRLNAIDRDDIASVNVVKDAEGTAVYGSRAANGAILIETKRSKPGKFQFKIPDNNYYDSKMIITSDGPKYALARRFYAPRYLTTEPRERTDYRETIYWNPVVQTDKTGTAQVEYYNSDATTTFRAIAEGIGYNGKAGRAEHTYITMNALQVDAKIPPYLTVDDRALIPLVIKNNNIVDASVRVKVSLPATMEAVYFPDTFQLPADSSRQLLIPVKAFAATTGVIQFTVETDQRTETVKLPITAVEKGFPVIETFSGNKAGKHEFAVSKMIPGSLHTQLKLFKSLEGTLLDGIESMLREPHGCFEQTSSTTYPNIYVLKYLKESGRANAEVEKKALAYIVAGYKRLLGFETKKNGFEWFGNTPPHEALTAYGLMEFTDMQEFIKVDQQMMQRTKQFLLSRRDGQGGFSLSSGGYDRFASVPNKIANIYIVYALSEAGMGSEIVPEYENAFTKAIESKDGYQMAMMALAASNMKRNGHYLLLMDALRTAYQKNGLVSETSVVNSRDASLRVETASLYALALMREQTSDIGLIAQLITRVLDNKSYYGYGSTQATVLALKAIVEYSKLIGKISENPRITFTMNNTNVGADSTLTVAVQEGKNVFSVQYGDKASAIPYTMQVSYNTYTPPNSAKAELTLTTKLAASQTRVGETMRMDIGVTNTKSLLQPMTIAKIGIPAGLSVQPWQLKELKEKGHMAYYELFDNYLVLYFMGFAAGETKTISLDLKADIAGTYKGKASNTYLYYTPEYKNWNDGVEVTIDAQ